MSVPNQNSNPTITELVRQHGEALAKLTTIVESHDKDLEAHEKEIGIIAKAVAQREAQDEFLQRFLLFGVPVITAVCGGLIDHFLPR